jgi:UDP-glucose 6-dehydrogenase
VAAAARAIAENMKVPLILVNKSTVPVGTGDWVSDIIRSSQPEPVPFSVVSCPEFLREGSAISDFMQPHRTVLGSMDSEAAEKVAQLHLSLRAPIVITDLRTAEMIKYSTPFSSKISFINKLPIFEAHKRMLKWLRIGYDNASDRCSWMQVWVTAAPASRGRKPSPTWRLRRSPPAMLRRDGNQQ